MDKAIPSQLSFADFAEAVKPSGAVSRFPAVGMAADVHVYTVYMNGDLGEALPIHAQEHSFKDVTVQALTEKLQLNPLSARDNLKVAEMVALRSSWMSAVLESSIGIQPRSAEVVADYELLSAGMDHPWIQSELDKQRELSAKLGPTLARAGVAKDVIPKEVSVGKVMAQDANFTLQHTQDGEIVTHENRRLQTLPTVGEKAMVSYYRGEGQVVDGQAKFSKPFVDPKTEDLAVRITSPISGLAPQVVLFNNVQSYAQFVEAHGLDEQLVQTAFNVRSLRPKKDFIAPAREPVSKPYIDSTSDCLAIDYEENGSVYTALFESAQAMGSLTREFSLGAKAIAEAHRLEGLRAELEVAGQAKHMEQALRESGLDMRAVLNARGYAFPENSGGQDRHYLGPIVAVTSMHVAQDIGRRQIVVHDIRTLDKAPDVGDRINIRFQDGRGTVTDMVKASKDLGR